MLFFILTQYKRIQSSISHVRKRGLPLVRKKKIGHKSCCLISVEDKTQIWEDTKRCGEDRWLQNKFNVTKELRIADVVTKRAGKRGIRHLRAHLFIFLLRSWVISVFLPTKIEHFGSSFGEVEDPASFLYEANQQFLLSFHGEFSCVLTAKLKPSLGILCFTQVSCY